jgi:uncharacterized protein YdeI (YjbR/CyaY-like superfamily)
MEQLYFKNRKEWRDWLRRNHNKNNGVWLVFYKKHTGKASLEYDDAVEEALCYGWIDSIIKKIDDDKYVRKLTPRKTDSKWSEQNKKRVKKLQKQGLMTKAGALKVDEARNSGLWDKSANLQTSIEMPFELKTALEKNKKARKFFDTLAPSYKKQFIGWITFAKRQETRDRRVKESMTLLERGEKLGMK